MRQSGKKLEFWVPLAVLLAGFAVTGLGAGRLRNWALEREREQFEILVDATTRAIEANLNRYGTLLRGVAGFFSSGIPVSEAAFAEFVARQRIGDLHPDIQYVAWMTQVSPEGKEAFISWARREISSDFEIWPKTAEASVVVTYIQPGAYEPLMLRGFDFMTEPARRVAVLDAVREGRTRLSPPVRLIRSKFQALSMIEPAIALDPPDGFLVLSPVFAPGDIPAEPEARRKSLIGLVGAGFMAEIFLDRVIGDQEGLVDIDLFDVTRTEPVPLGWQRISPPEHSPRHVAERRRRVLGREWLVRFKSLPEFESQALWASSRVAMVFGVLASALLSALSRQLLLMRREAQISRELERSQTELIELNRNLERIVQSRTEIAENRARQLRELAEELVRAEQRERSRIAHILHDDLQQILVAIKLRLMGAGGRMDEDTREGVLDLVAKAIKSARSLSAQLDPGVLKAKGLAGALEWTAAKAKENLGLEVKLDLDPEAEPVSDDLKLFLVRSAQEALLNVVKHAGTLEAELRLARVDHDSIEMSVTDSGKGCPQGPPADAKAGEHFGVLNMKNRIEFFGGRFEMITGEGAGCRVRLVVPAGERGE